MLLNFFLTGVLDSYPKAATDRIIHLKLPFSQDLTYAGLHSEMHPKNSEMDQCIFFSIFSTLKFFIPYQNKVRRVTSQQRFLKSG